jgi:hypothetical protein
MISASENGYEVATAVDDPQHLDHVAGRDPVENDIRRNRNGAHLARDRRPVVADPALSRRDAEQRTAVEDAIDDRLSPLGAIRRDVTPNRFEVAARWPGDADARQLAFGRRRALVAQLASHVFEVKKVAAIGRFDALLNVGPKPLEKRIALRVVHVPGDFRDPARSAILAGAAPLTTPLPLLR